MKSDGALLKQVQEDLFSKMKGKNSQSLMEFLIAVTDDKFHQVISAKGNASKLVTILSNNSGLVGQGQRCQNSVPLSGSKTSIQPQFLGVYCV